MLKKRMIAGLFATVTGLICFVFAQNAISQQQESSLPTSPPVKTPESPQMSLPSDYNCDNINLKIKNFGLSDITKERDLIITEIGGLKEKIKGINDVLPEAFTDEEITYFKKQEEERKKTPEKFKDSAYRLIDTSQPSKEKLKDDLKTQNQFLSEKSSQLRCFDLKISNYNTPEQDFKKTMSIIFAILIGLVIIGFFILSWKDELMRRAIFSGQTGIQFLTLFSIVIAIILFGITGILQDKELAALLGGLSGYILGRYSSSNPSPPTPPAAGNG